MKGKLIVVEGLDGSGKATQTARLFETLEQRGMNVRKVSFPNYGSEASGPLRMYLAGDFGTSPDAVNPYAASSFFAVDRFAAYKSDWGGMYENGGVIIADRYTTSNAIHQCSKLPEDKWDGFLEWLFTYEYELMGIPAPDSVIYLRVDPDVSQELLDKRYDNHSEKKDIHERDLDYLKRSRRAADYCAKKLGWLTIECISGGKMRTIEEIAAEIAEKLDV